MRLQCAFVVLIWSVVVPPVVHATDSVRFEDADVLEQTETHWSAVLRFSRPEFSVTSVELDDTRYYVDIAPAQWVGAPVARRETNGGVIAYRWAQFASTPPTVRFVVEHRKGWSCSSVPNGRSVEVRCRAISADPPLTAERPTGTLPRETTATSEGGGCTVVARVRGLELCTPLDGYSGELILARSLEYTPEDSVVDGLPHFGAVRDDWMGSPRTHQGVDIYGDQCDVLAMADGEVVGAGRGPRSGGWIKLSHGHGIETVLVHVRRIDVDRGDIVRRGQRIGRIDGPVGNAVEAQLHLELRLDGVSVDPAPLFAEASPAKLNRAWKTAIAAIPQRVRNREREREVQERMANAPATTDNSHAHTRAP